MLPEIDTLENGKDLKDTELQHTSTSTEESLLETLSMTRETDTELSTGPMEPLIKDAGRMAEEPDLENTSLKLEMSSSKNGMKDPTEITPKEFPSDFLLMTMECKSFKGFGENF